MNTPPFNRTKCACNGCKACCKRQPGPLAPDDFERIAAFLGETPEEAEKHFWASPGALIREGEDIKRVGTVTPKRIRGRCVFLDDNDNCKIHPVAPFGCAYFDTHQSLAQAQERSTWLVLQQMASEAYRKLRDRLPYATSYKPQRY